MAVSMNGISGNDYADIISASQTGRLQNTISGAGKDNQDQDKMLEACKEFETYMIEQIYKSMEKTIIKADEDENQYEEYFGDMQIQEYAKSAMEQGGFGLAKQLYESMVRNQGVSSVTVTDEE